MAELIDTVADLTDLRDRDDLQVTLANVTMEVAGAESLILWQIILSDGSVSLHKRLELCKANGPALPSASTPIPLATVPLLEACHATRRDVANAGDNGLWRHIFPILEGRNAIGIIELLCPGELQEAQRRLVCGLLRIYGNHLAMLDYSDRDQLTGLLNRRTFEDAFARIAASHKSTHLAVIDIDFFKRINDQFGHPYGDEVLVLLSRLMMDSFRETDRLYRFGGEEFVIILPGTDLAAAEAVVQRFRAIVEAYTFGQVGNVTISIGLTGLRVGDTGPAAFGRADQALYAAKHAGRNQVQCHELLVAAGRLAHSATSDQEVELF